MDSAEKGLMAAAGNIGEKSMKLFNEGRDIKNAVPTPRKSIFDSESDTIYMRNQLERDKR